MFITKMSMPRRTFLRGLGATVALRLALDAPDRVERLALLSAAAGRTEEERQRVMERLAIVEHGIPGEHFRRSLPRWFSDEFRRANAALLERYAHQEAGLGILEVRYGAWSGREASGPGLGKKDLIDAQK